MFVQHLSAQYLRRLVPKRAASWTLAASLCASATPALAQTLRAQAPDQEPDAAPHVEVLVEAERPLLVSSPRAPTAASSVLGRERLERAGDNTADVLEQVPGVVITRTGAASEPATASIRGTSASQTPVYLSGIRLNDEVSGSADLSRVPLWMLQRVEVFRGNAPVGSTRLGLAGAVFLVPRTPERSRAIASVGFGSFGARAASLGGEIAADGAAALVAIRRASATNDYWFTNDQGQRFDLIEAEERRSNADSKEGDAWAVGQFAYGQARVTSLVHAFERERGVTGVATTAARLARARERRLLGGASVTLPCAPSGDCQIALRSSALIENTTLRDPSRELRTLQTDWLHVHGERFEQGARLDWQSGQRLTFGFDLEHASSALRLSPRSGLSQAADRRVVGASAELEARPGDGWLVHASSSVRCDFTHGSYVRLNRLSTTTTQTCNASAPNGRVGVAFELSPTLTALSNLGYTSRLPTLGELYGTSAAVTGNPELAEESSLNADLGLRSRARMPGLAFELDAFVFARWANELIRYRQASMNAFAPYNVASARVLGAELMHAWTLFEHLRLDGAVTLQDALETTADSRDPSENDVLPLSPRLVMRHALEAFAGFPEQGVRRAALGVAQQYRSNRLIDPAGLASLPAVQSWDAHARVDLRRPELALSASVNNLFDARTLDVIGLPLPSRSVFLTVEVVW